MGNLLVINNPSVDFSEVAVEQVRIINNDGPVISFMSNGLTEITPYNGTVATYYTTDGSKPTINSTLYTAPFTVALGTTVKAVSVYADNTLTDISSNSYQGAGWDEVDLSEYTNTRKSVGYAVSGGSLTWSDVISNYESYIIPVESGQRMRVTCCVWGVSSKPNDICPAAYLRNDSVGASIINKVSISPTTIIDEKTAACFSKVEFTIPNNSPFLLVQGRTPENANFVSGYALKLEYYVV